ncbi:class I SAM-dependent DNA methyltransferase [Propionibacteriaceae bacterium Y1700]|uniref:class I SAM-dependent DNA methyltransferase n=1 Tax=Microlunatus sp. Y1700 TaxID=3418487 RepID=UPI003DA6EB31
MDGFDPATSFGADAAARYDDEPRGDEELVVRFLAELAGDQRALEFAIGTGRIALPLSRAGVDVDGIELSPDMVEVLRRDPVGVDLAVALGDMSRADAPGGPYGLVYLVFNTIGNLITQEDQVRCFANAARHLTEDGAFVIETGTGWDWIKDRDNYVDAERVDADAVTLDVCRYDRASQLLEENHVRITADGIRLSPIVQRIAAPSELDLMARLAGLRLTERYGWWDRRPFDRHCATHVSVYRRV